jgi:hypothetical protein
MYGVCAYASCTSVLLVEGGCLIVQHTTRQWLCIPQPVPHILRFTYVGHWLDGGGEMSKRCCLFGCVEAHLGIVAVNGTPYKRLASQGGGC